MADMAPVSTPPRVLPPNDPRQYDDLAGEWWRPDGAFAMLHWLARARAALVPPASRPDALLVDLGCGAGLLAPHLAGKGYRHVGVDLTRSALAHAAGHGVTVVNADATAVPLADGCADVVSAGELLEHVPDWRRAVAEACRLLRPGGLLVLDTLNDTLLARLIAVEISERLPTVPRGIHDPRLFVDARALVAECARHGVALRLRGVRPELGGTLAWLLRRLRASRGGRGPTRTEPRIVPTWSTAVLYQGRGVRGG
ncbi:bifunctional 3-demethylubiquinone 3-O-methyltransferase/2-octaprenyl-6-hydroxy phenol methylase [Micromonospora globispora]|uniref:Bifunctional 3-demethylubiquinone 3-O-methyltransferase/2-octaprenyl-6-hydroxy phenol methylase n=2 Tax=Micromonospora globispora TaxID=1450148 RepID=A0A317K0N2_9ACTN|nr:methyltransferase domain-containing protein [Micromonospora globispora]PWU46546.1 bifunctional 3-demethylubiquinone 3-O-methyltransferase/2-octaprenyl-6-hydroxy phenol methylase [Micromonospora globispora]